MNASSKTQAPAQRRKIAIIGCGPTGLTAASMLGQAGHSVIVIERQPEPYGLPRLSHIDGETARLVQSAGDVEHALRDASALEQYFFYDDQGDVLIDMDWRGDNSGFPAHIAIFQPEIEEAMYLRAQSLPNVEFLRGWEVNGMDAEGGTVTISAHPWEEAWTGAVDKPEETRRFEVDYVIGADGANSYTRRTLGIERFSYGKHERWLNLDSEYVRDLGDRFTKGAIYCDPARAHMFIPIGKSRVRFEVRLLPGEETAHWEDIKNGLAWLKKQHELTLEDVKPIRNVVYTFDPAIAKSWKQGNILLAGDAAHTMMPYMGQGACSGIRDGSNLAWKLDLVLSGKADPALLETYESERRPHVTVITETSNMLGAVANEDDLEKVAARNEMFRSGNMPPPPAFPRVETGVVHTEADGGLHPATGAPTPQGRMRQGDREGRMDELTGGGFLIVAREDPSAVLDAGARGFLKDLGCRWVVVGDAETTGADALRDLDGDQLRYMETHGFAAYLRRPDFLLFGGVSSLSELPTLITDLRDKLCWTAPQPAAAATESVA
ncbi:bifunctional 3-(3-hydroxy-phenyl)propionate/3-hydroxycinnamic acid hydroxylase [Sulfitobacter pseudonitzschiae]|uniref:Bifunctional 3-(3-hydroxy-phenyl)propionate/3-hydroxycinnamic acid hydroxylase n=1 Tax=Pseudosulfitobacter pseudonitzschiae TaxID=1402135 RepID=A0A9Q2P525_9RHOB|nr:bifunctional 3-(3-hydroxy-phenyl)propionate/3-hydroxycinnamic acid hydroxylase [Pseudosulfitobacter pseudonitzschiae]MBM2294503.1 bifunctional 3-(3-hydroxy-phenyl)propionate/3-hydroxycinnamic acid hydroxylase [Pseudosulfitobacter pseudonitzschiae]MBM2299471.1 bifunctional 3-(3-hydroxy-phenyl)propionate/3-hydroxycinnamic acid hydroxylase [Pseudosulfitobacter pseudonitzschiae]MBM2304335.1 bifunctional 3-(3-hydroxy-phenyl)propionate/3-hydroxycinnamic acid hydroxylase [Pseudosulfitobacter pseudon